MAKKIRKAYSIFSWGLKNQAGEDAPLEQTVTSPGITTMHSCPRALWISPCCQPICDLPHAPGSTAATLGRTGGRAEPPHCRSGLQHGPLRPLSGMPPGPCPWATSTCAYNLRQQSHHFPTQHPKAPGPGHCTSLVLLPTASPSRSPTAFLPQAALMSSPHPPRLRACWVLETPQSHHGTSQPHWGFPCAQGSQGSEALGSRRLPGARHLPGRASC